MRIDFKALTHFMGTGNQTVLELFFEDVFAKSRIYEQHCDNTTNLYRSEMKAVVDKAKASFQELADKANARYEELLADIENSTADDSQMAFWESGLSNIEPDEHEEYLQSIRQRFADTAEHFNRASLVTFYSLMESCLRKACTLLKKEMGQRIDLSDLKDKNYLDTIKAYFDLVLNMPVTELEPLLTRFIEVQHIRNKIIHHNGLFPVENNKDIIEKIEKDPHLGLVRSEDDKYCEVKVKRIKYVQELYPLLDDMFTKLLWLVENKLDYPIFKRNLSHLFDFVTKVDKVEMVEVKAGKSIHCIIETSDPLFGGVDCKWTVTKAGKKAPASITAQFDHDHELMTRLIDVVADDPELITHNLFGLFLPQHAACGISILFSPFLPAQPPA